MLVQMTQVLDAEQVRHVRTRLDTAGEAWVDGQVTAGYQGARVKRNLQIDEGSAVARELGDLVLSALERNPLFISAALPNRVYPPMFNRYDASMYFGHHVDNAVRLLPGRGDKIRMDVSATLFISEPDEYDGGELMIENTYGTHSVKLRAGDMVLYPASSLHRVAPISRGARLACFLWIQSMIRDDGQRTLLYDMDTSIQRLTATGADEPSRVQLAACYHNLLRMWAEV